MQLSEIFVYPIKSAGGLSLTEARLDEFGIADDRRWMVVDEAGDFLTQRSEPRLALIRPRLGRETLDLSAPALPSLEVPRECAGPACTVRVWNDAVSVTDCGPEASLWLTRLLGRPTRLVHLPAQSVRPLDPQYGNHRISFVDAFPLLLIGQASLDDLNRRLAVPLPMNRFRPNFVVTGAAPYAEDDWGAIRIGELSFRRAKACERCVTTTVNQDTAEQGKEPLATLATYRRADGNVLFGQNLVHEGQGVVRAGDSVLTLAF